MVFGAYIFNSENEAYIWLEHTFGGWSIHFYKKIKQKMPKKEKRILEKQKKWRKENKIHFFQTVIFLKKKKWKNKMLLFLQN